MYWSLDISRYLTSAPQKSLRPCPLSSPLLPILANWGWGFEVTDTTAWPSRQWWETVMRKDSQSLAVIMVTAKHFCLYQWGDGVVTVEGDRASPALDTKCCVPETQGRQSGGGGCRKCYEMGSQRSAKRKLDVRTKCFFLSLRMLQVYCTTAVTLNI